MGDDARLGDADESSTVACTGAGANGEQLDMWVMRWPSPSNMQEALPCVHRDMSVYVFMSRKEVKFFRYQSTKLFCYRFLRITRCALAPIGEGGVRSDTR